MDIEKLHLLKDIKALIVGDFMVDKYIQGNVKRISPEAPVPILEVKSKSSKLGGAGNVVNNIISLGGKTRVIGCVGDDHNGNWLIEKLKEQNVDISYLKKYNEVQTICKTRLVAKNQQFLRYDEEIIRDIPHIYEEFISENIEEVLNDIQVIIISDYAKGTITNNLSQLVITQANLKNIPVVVDPKGKDYSKYNGATLCTPNINELSIVTGKECNQELVIEEAGQQLCNKINLNYLVLTRSEKGISLFEKGSILKIDYPAVIKDVIDVTGAGDTVASVIALCLAGGYTINECCKLANLAASIVCSKFGAATLSLNELLECILDSGEFKLVDLNTAKYIAASLREKGKKIVFTNGCFDLLHAGHLSSFIQAKTFGDVLIVAVNSDASVKKIKGESRPIINEKDRIQMLCALECVDYVVLMEDDTPINLINAIRPDVTVKGKDWRNKELPERSVVESYGGKVNFIDLEAGLSTTKIIEKIVRG